MNSESKCVLWVAEGWEFAVFFPKLEKKPVTSKLLILRKSAKFVRWRIFRLGLVSPLWFLALFSVAKDPSIHPSKTTQSCRFFTGSLTWEKWRESFWKKGDMTWHFFRSDGSFMNQEFRSSLNPFGIHWRNTGTAWKERPNLGKLHGKMAWGFD